MTSLIKQFINETLYHAWRYKGGKRVGDSIEVEADNTRDAGFQAARIFGGGIDPFSIDLEEKSPTQIGPPRQEDVESFIVIIDFTVQTDEQLFNKLSGLGWQGGGAGDDAYILHPDHWKRLPMGTPITGADPMTDVIERPQGRDIMLFRAISDRAKERIKSSKLWHGAAGTATTLISLEEFAIGCLRSGEFSWEWLRDYMRSFGVDPGF